MAGRFPFPHDRHADRCTYARSVGAREVRAAFDAWAGELVTSDGAAPFLRVRCTSGSGPAKDATVSEGIAYGMIIAVMMDQRPLFDGLWGYAQRWAGRSGLMHWRISANGRTRLDAGAATDADQDVAWALAMAARQWGGKDLLGVSYHDRAQQQIARIWRHEVNHAHAGQLLPGDSWSDAARPIPFNPSYFAPGHYRLFGALSGDRAGWGRVIDTGYAIVDRAQSAAGGTGLVPAWCDSDGAPVAPFGGAAPGYQYDAARVPFRLAQDWCFAGEPRARDHLARSTAFFTAIGAARIADGYDLDGTPRPASHAPSAAFVGGAAAGAMHDPRHQAFIDDAAALLATGQLVGQSRYYDLSWTALALLMLTGNLVEL